MNFCLSQALVQDVAVWRIDAFVVVWNHLRDGEAVLVVEPDGPVVVRLHVKIGLLYVRILARHAQRVLQQICPCSSQREREREKQSRRLSAFGTSQ